MLKTSKNKVLKKIAGKGKGWVFSATDFLSEFKRWEIDRSLADLTKEGKILRLTLGLYYYPQFSELLNKNVAPDMQEVARALARKYEWKIFPEGNTALNYLNLSTQIPSKHIYISSGRNCEYKIENQSLQFYHRVPKESTIDNENANLVIQSLKSLGKDQANQPDFINQLSKRFSYDEWLKIESASTKVAYWILDIIKKAKEIANEQNR
jgi:hypothetical protein